jgi:hypothetical protein
MGGTQALTINEPGDYTKLFEGQGLSRHGLVATLYPKRTPLMNGSIRSWTWCAGLVFVALAVIGPVSAFGEAEQPGTAGNALVTESPYRKLAPGVMQSVDPELYEEETVSRHPIVELLAVDPNLEQAKEVRFHREIWYLEFQFKPVRMIEVDVPQADGRMRRKLIWYVVYSVTNPGKVMPSEEGPDGKFRLQDSGKPIRFIPEFRLYSHEFGKWYQDRVIPMALGPIGTREDPKRKFYNSVEMAARPIKPGETVWGAVTWEDVDPRIDRFSIYVNGLTNAYRWQDTPGAYKPDDPLGKGRTFVRKALKLNFWRPGDEFDEHEKEIRYGIPGELDYEWVYR